MFIGKPNIGISVALGDSSVEGEACQLENLDDVMYSCAAITGKIVCWSMLWNDGIGFSWLKLNMCFKCSCAVGCNK